MHQSSLFASLKVSGIVLSIAFGLGSCKTRDSSDSSVKVVNGSALKDTDFPAVIQIGYDLGGGSSAMCTATWASDRTVLTAAHCIEGGDSSPGKVSVVRGTGKGLRAKRVISHPTYRPNSGVGHDIAIVIFEKDSSKFYIPMALTQAKAGDPLTIIGFGKFDHLNGKSGGTKRRGNNKVSAIDYQGRVDFDGLISPLNKDGTGERVTNSQGDSGGPMIIKQRVQGVSSSVSKISNNQNQGHYESVRAPAIEDWLKKLAASGVYMTGFSQGTESITATDTTVSGGDAGSAPAGNPDASNDDETPPPAPSAGPDSPDSPDSPGTPETPDVPGSDDANPNPTPNPAPQPAQIVDCNRDFSKIRQGGSGICLNRSSGFCYRYSGGNVQYSQGRTTCAAPGSSNPGSGVTPPSSSNTLDCNANFSTIRAGGSGICLNRSSGFCYRYSGGSILYNSGRVSCP